MARRFITSECIKDLMRDGKTFLETTKSDVITPDAKDFAERHGFVLHSGGFRKPFVCGNWKMNGDLSFTMKFFEDLMAWCQRKRDIWKSTDIMLAPPSPLLLAALPIVNKTPLFLAAQNGYHKEKGAFTGENSMEILKSCGVKIVLTGHSERRHIFGETDEIINLKTKKALELSLIPILCIGEQLEERENGSMYDIIKSQLIKGFDGIQKNKAADVIVAYEPVWAIGTGKVASLEDIDSMHKFIRNTIKELYGEENSAHMRILYGGSVNGKNSFEISNISDVDGVLVGGASLKIDEFIKIIENFSGK